MNKLSHDEAFVELAGVALDSVTSELSSAVREHAAVCPECGSELAAMEETVAQLAHVVPQRAVNRGRGAGIRSRLVMRARSEREARLSAAPGPPDLARGVASLTGLGHKLTPGTQRAVDAQVKKAAPSQKQRRVFSAAYLVAAAAVIAFAASAIQLMRVTSDRDKLKSELAERTSNPTPNVTIQPTNANEKAALIAAMAGPGVKIVSLANKSATQMGRMFWNPDSNDWTMVVYTMSPPKPGMTYQVWLVTDSAKISAGTFRPDSTGHAFMQAKYHLERNALKAVAVTEEPMPGMPSPTGPIIVSGSVNP